MTGIETPEIEIDSDVEARRYFDLFKDALATEHATLAYNPTTDKVAVIANNTAIGTFHFPFSVEAMKNHYCTYRLSSSVHDYLDTVRTTGVVSCFCERGMYTLTATGNVEVTS
jgi:hypothetical protein